LEELTKVIEPGVKPGRFKFCPEVIVAPPLNVARPVTPRVVPTVSALVTDALLSVARPDVERVESEELPVTPRVPPRVVAPVPTVKVLVPVTEVLPLRETVPVPVEKVAAPFWEILPEVVRSPRLSIVNLEEPPLWISKALLVEPLVLLTINDSAELWLVRTKEVGEARPDARVKAMLLPEVVVIELPPLYADCKVIDEALHCVTSFEPLIHNGVPAALVRPFNVKKLEEVVLTTTLLPAVGVKTEFPLAWKLLFAVRVAETVAEFKTERLLFSVVKPLAAPIAMVVAAPPMFRVETPEFRRLKVPAVDVRVPPLTARVPPRVVAPVPTVKVLVPVTEVLPLRETVPVPVEKVPEPDWAKLPDD
jgi:hypothetical protein